MKRSQTRVTLLLAASTLFLGLALHSEASAAVGTTRTVCASGCDFTTIQAAVNAATAGDTINVGAGTYTENVTINKRLIIDGAGSGSNPSTNTIITAASSGTSTVVYTAGGSDASNRQSLRDLRVTGATGGTGNNNSGILFSGASMGYFTIENIVSTNNAGHGLVSNLAPASATLTDVIITGSAFSNNGSAGIRTASHSVDGFILTNSTFTSNSGLGLAFNTSDNATAQVGGVTLNGVTFSGNNSTADLYAFRMLGNMSLTNVDFLGSNGSGLFGLYLLGGYVNQASAPAIGTVILNDVTVSGTYTSAGISFLGYSNLAGVSMADVVLNTTVPTADRGHMRLNGVAGTLDLGNTAFGGTTPLDIRLSSNFGSAGSIATVQVDATDATFNGVLGSAMSLSQLFAVEDRIRHTIDGATDATGFVRVKSGQVFVTANSFALPATTPSIQRGVDAATAGDTINVGAGTYNENSILITKSVTIVGPNWNVLGAGSRSAEAIVKASMHVRASGITIKGLSIDGVGTVNKDIDLQLRGVYVYNSGGKVLNTTITNNIITGWITGVATAGAVNTVDGIVITGNKIVNHVSGIGITEEALNLTITNNTMVNSGISLAPGSTLAAPLTGNSFSGGINFSRLLSVAPGVTTQTIDEMFSANTFDFAEVKKDITDQWYTNAIYTKAAPLVTADDSANTITGLTVVTLTGTYFSEFLRAMEYSSDAGSTWSQVANPVFTGNQTVLVRFKAIAPNVPTSNITTLSFTPVTIDNATLSGLVLSSGTLSPVFASGTTTYGTASVINSVSSVTVTPTTSVNAATIQIKVNGGSYAPVTSGSASSSLSLIVGSNTIYVKVTAQDGATTQTYTVTVTRQSNDSTLSGLVLSTGTLSPVFASGTTTYTARVTSAIRSMTITPTKSDSNATFVQYVGATGTNSFTGGLSSGETVIRIVVTSQDGSTTQTYTVTVPRLTSQTISFNPAGSRVATSEYTLPTASASSGLGVTFTSLTEDICLVSVTTLTPVKAGACVVRASQAGDGVYSPATRDRTITITRAPQSITTFAPTAMTMLSGAQILSASPGAGTAPVTFEVTSAGICSIEGGNKLFVQAAGDCLVKASQAEDDKYAATSITKTIQISKVATPVTFTPSNMTMLSNPQTLSALPGDSTAPVTFEVTSASAGICRIDDGNSLIALATGDCLVKASRAADETYTATSITKTIKISKGAQIITFNPTQVLLGVTATPDILVATANSGLSVTLTSLTPLICDVNVRSLQMNKFGRCIIRASQAGDLNYLPASIVERSITISKDAQAALTVANSNAVSIAKGVTGITLNPGGGSGNGGVSYKTRSYGCRITSNVLWVPTSERIGAVVNCSVTVTKATDDRYLAQTSVAKIFTFSP